MIIKKNNLRVVITGASGFIGRPLSLKLADLGYEVLAISRVVPTWSEKSKIFWLEADLSSPLSYQKKIKSFRPEVVIHLAWQDIPDFSFEKSVINLSQSLEFLNFVIGIESCKKILISGSCWEYGRVKGECLETDLALPKDHFTWAKNALYSWLHIICKQKDIQLLWMRIFYAYGPGQRLESLIPSILTNLKQGKLPELRTPKNANDFIYVDDIVNAFSQAVVVNNSSMIYNLGSGVSSSAVEVCRIAENIILGTETLTQEIDIRSKSTICDVDFWADFTQSKRYLDWQPTTSLVDGIYKTWQWLNYSE